MQKTKYIGIKVLENITKEQRKYKMKGSCWLPKILLEGGRLIKSLSCMHMLLSLKKQT